MNLVSPHGFYRDRLSKAYLFRCGNSGCEHLDTLRLSQLNGNGSAAPYHIINTTLNMPNAEDWTARGRRAASFIFSKFYVGCSRTGYQSTEEMESADQHLNLGTAMAISGAAFAPNRGIYTKPALAFVMAMLNVRTGYWLGNPNGRGRHPAGPNL